MDDDQTPWWKFNFIKSLLHDPTLVKSGALDATYKSTNTQKSSNFWNSLFSKLCKIYGKSDPSDTQHKLNVRSEDVLSITPKNSRKPLIRGNDFMNASVRPLISEMISFSYILPYITDEKTRGIWQFSAMS